MQFPCMHIAYYISMLFSLVLLDTLDTLGYKVKVCTDNIPSARNVNNAPLQFVCNMFTMYMQCVCQSSIKCGVSSQRNLCHFFGSWRVF